MAGDALDDKMGHQMRQRDSDNYTDRDDPVVLERSWPKARNTEYKGSTTWQEMHWMTQLPDMLPMTLFILF